jgi:hypothetical protein
LSTGSWCLDRGRIAGEFKKADVTLDELIERLDLGRSHRQVGTGEKRMNPGGLAAGRSPLPLWLRSNSVAGRDYSGGNCHLGDFCSLASPETFFRPNISQAFMSTTPFLGSMALPLTMVVITGRLSASPFLRSMTVSRVGFCCGHDGDRQSLRWRCRRRS